MNPFEHDERVKEVLDKLNESLKGATTFCDYTACLVRYTEHYHIDEHTLTFRKPEVYNGSIQRTTWWFI